MIRTRAKVLTIGVLVVAAGLGGCTQHPPPGAKASSIGDRAAREVMADALERIYGTSEQRAAGWEGEHYAVQDVLDRCAERKNVAYTVNDWMPSDGSSPSHAVDLAGLFEPARTDFGIAGGFLMQVRLRPSSASRPTDVERAQSSRFNECRMEAATMDNLHRPAGQWVLEQKFLADQSMIHHELEPRLIGWYSTCMTHAGLPAEDMSDAYGQAQRKFLPLVYQPPLNPTAAQRWAEAVTFEKRIAAADGRCRKANAAAVAMASAATVKTFLDKHRNEVEAVTAGWAAMPAIRDAARKAAGK